MRQVDEANAARSFEKSLGQAGLYMLSPITVSAKDGISWSDRRKLQSEINFIQGNLDRISVGLWEMMNEVKISYGENANSSSVSNYSELVIRESAAKSGDFKLLISSTARTAQDQARIMKNNIDRYGVKAQKALYGKYGDMIIDEYVKTGSVTKMAALIMQIGPAKVSLHTADINKINVIDISPRSLNGIRSFENAVKMNPNINRYLMPPSDPGFHIEILQP
jgi:hypothetical protein